MQPLIYLASPYTHPDRGVVQSRFNAVCVCAGNIMRTGRHVFSPIAHTHPIANAVDLPKRWEFWKAYDTVMLERCSELFVLAIDGWRESIGVREEMAIAAERGMPITFVGLDGKPVEV